MWYEPDTKERIPCESAYRGSRGESRSERQEVPWGLPGLGDRWFLGTAPLWGTTESLSADGDDGYTP